MSLYPQFEVAKAVSAAFEAATARFAHYGRRNWYTEISLKVCKYCWPHTILLADLCTYWNPLGPGALAKRGVKWLRRNLPVTVLAVRSPSSVTFMVSPAENDDNATARLSSAGKHSQQDRQRESAQHANSMKYFFFCAHESGPAKAHSLWFMNTAWSVTNYRVIHQVWTELLLTFYSELRFCIVCL